MLYKRPKAWLPPDVAMRKYTRLLHTLIRELNVEAVNELKQYNLLKLDDDEEDKHAWNERMKEIFAALLLFLSFRRSRFMFLLIFFDINKFNDTQFRQVVKSMGVTLPLSQSLPKLNPFEISAFEDVKKAFGEVSDYSRFESWLKATQDNWLAQNELLVKGLVEKQLQQIELIVRRGVSMKTPMLEMLNLIEAAAISAEKHATLIARDQVNKLNSELTKKREQSLNQTQYRWITCRDERVRGDPMGLYPNAIPSHYARDTKIFNWDSPPEGGHPGEAINCRCRAEMIVK